MSKKKLAIFDLDGTLFDTADVNYHAYLEAMQPFGFSVDRDFFFKECNGMHYTTFLPQIMGDSEHIEEVHKAKKIAYKRHLGKARENIHLFNMIKVMKNSYNIAIVTTASQKNTLDLLCYFGHVDLFDLLLAQEDVEHVKPDPEGFLKAMESFNIDAKNTVIFEDSNAGIQAARATGASVMIVDKF